MRQRNFFTMNYIWNYSYAMITELLLLSHCCLITFQFCDGFNIALLVNVLVV